MMSGLNNSTNSNNNNNNTPPTTLPPGVTGVPIDKAKMGNVATVGPRRIYRLDATGTIERTRDKKIEVHIRAVWDSLHFNQNTTSGDINDMRGTWVYWRMD